MPHVVAWNLTRRCNLRCTHCYISAGPWETADAELDTAACRRVVDELLAVNPAPMLILSGGEPLVRADLTEIAGYASARGATVVVGTNGTLLTAERIAALRDAGVAGVAVSVDSLRPKYHDNFRRAPDALAATTAALERLRAQRLDFIIQTTATKGNAREIPELVEWAAEQGAVCFNLYFLVPTGRGEQLSDLAAAEYEALLGLLVEYDRRYRGAMMVRAKCAPHFIRRVYEESPDSPILNYRTRCPCGIEYCRITPEGKVTPCPFMPTVVGDLRAQAFGDIWANSAVFADLRRRELGGKCGRCEYRRICGGCRARALALTGDYLAADPSCAYEPTGERPVIERARDVTYGSAATPSLTWTAPAEERLRRVPSFVRAVVVRRVEEFARARGLSTVTPELLGEIRAALPVDFSKRKPFFLRDD
ncbi:MAG: radical SAM protein [Gemmatimonadetes bacterium]|nr:radical SAM protein [Gemmatimonadota bacterium]